MATDVVPEQETNPDEEYTTAEVADVETDEHHWDPLAWPETTVNPVQVRWRYAMGIPCGASPRLLSFLAVVL